MSGVGITGEIRLMSAYAAIALRTGLTNRVALYSA
jgi:hypothetical protein